jgi:hypothetical protein
MPSDSKFQDSVEKSREALRRSIADEHDIVEPARRVPEPRSDVPRERSIVSDLNPFFRGLLETLPEPGIEWPSTDREQWLETARNIFALLYCEPSEVREPIPLRQPHPASMYPAEQRSA